MATGTSKTPILIVPTTLPGPPAIPIVLTSPSAAAAGPGGYNNLLVYFYLNLKIYTLPLTPLEVSGFVPRRILPFPVW